MHLNRKQRPVVWGGLVAMLLCLSVGWWWQTFAVAAIAGVLIWKFSKDVERPEIAVVKSVRCGGCGNIGEPHWKTCPRCGASDWKS